VCASMWRVVRTPEPNRVATLFRAEPGCAMLCTAQMQTDHSTVRVLIVDDQAAFRRAARNVVELTPGFVVAAEVETGEAAIDVVSKQELDLVLMDVRLPGIDGLEACRRMLAASNRRQPVVVLLSTYSAAEYVEESNDCGAAGYLAKAEFGSERLSAVWAGAVGKHA